MPDAIADKILDLIAAVKKIPREKVTINSTFEELGLDSLDAINLIFEIESTFDVSVPDETVKSLSNVQQLVEKLKTILPAEKLNPASTPE
jgi:acyl carrier protein